MTFYLNDPGRNTGSLTLHDPAEAASQSQVVLVDGFHSVSALGEPVVAPGGVAAAVAGRVSPAGFGAVTVTAAPTGVAVPGLGLLSVFGRVTVAAVMVAEPCLWVTELPVPMLRVVED